MVEADWLCLRETFNEMVTLTRVLNEVLGPHVIVSYTMGLWECCASLLFVFDS